jgi:hypothetical protein
MFQHLLVKNFRGFSSLHLKQLARVNLIAGQNNTGKTSLLEAIYLHCHPANCALPVQVHLGRGIEEPSNDVEAVCRWLFWQGHLPGGLELASWDVKGVHRVVTIQLLDPERARELVPEDERMLGLRGLLESEAPRLVIRYEETNKGAVTSIGLAKEGHFHAVGARIPWKIPCLLLTSGLPPSQSDVEFFGKLELDKRQEEILPALRILEPRLERLSVIPLAGKPILHGDIGLPRLVPVPFLGEGMRRLLSIILAVANAPGGVVLIDEIENGLHHTILKPVWQAIAQAARQADVQVFAATHSYECITAAHEAFTASSPYDLRLYRLDRVQEEIQVAAYDQEILSYATEMSHEVR